jgi:hypothetical protein
MDHAWAAEQLQAFASQIRTVKGFREASWLVDGDNLQFQSDLQSVIEELLTLEPVMRQLMNAAQPGLGDYERPAGRSEMDTDYWIQDVQPWALRAIGIHTIGTEVRERMLPNSPDLVAEQLHPWVWDAAMPLWQAGSIQEAVQTAARSVNARLQQKLAKRSSGEAVLCREAFSPDPPADGRPRLRFPGDRTSPTWRSRQGGARDFGAGCFEAIRNPASHEHDLGLSEQVALEQLAAFSLLARWIEECLVDSHLLELTLKCQTRIQQVARTASSMQVVRIRTC